MSNKKALLIIVSILLTIIVMLGIAVLYFKTDIFKSYKELFGKYFAQNGVLFEMLQNENMDSQYEFRTSNNYTSTGDLLIMLKTGNERQEIKANTNVRHDANSMRTYAELNLKKRRNRFAKSIIY